MHRFVFALKKRLDAVLLDDNQNSVQGFLVGVEGLIPYGRGIFPRR
jgi:hypothetical protein